MVAVQRGWNVLGVARLTVLGLLLLAVLVLAGFAGSGWSNPSAASGLGPVHYPVQDCGRNWVLFLITPEGEQCVRGTVREETLQTLARERGIWDASVQQAREMFYGLLQDVQSWFSTGTGGGL